MNLKEQFNGIQHIGIPTNDIEATIDFYKALGFEIAFRTVNEEADEEVAFLKLNTLVVETYENKAAKMEAGAIDHMAIDVKDIEKVYEMINQAGLNTTNDTVHFLPFWENGVLSDHCIFAVNSLSRTPAHSLCSFTHDKNSFRLFFIIFYFKLFSGFSQ